LPGQPVRVIAFLALDSCDWLIKAESSTDSKPARLKAMGEGYRRLLADENLLRWHLQGYAAASDPEIRDHMRTLCMKNFDTVRSLTGYDGATVARFFATGMLLNIGARG
jgi:hypothetical protein